MAFGASGAILSKVCACATDTSANEIAACKVCEALAMLAMETATSTPSIIEVITVSSAISIAWPGFSATVACAFVTIFLNIFCESDNASASDLPCEAN